MIHLVRKRNRGWPWPETTFGLSSMYGDDGWCAKCGVPNRPQTGAMTLQAKGFAGVAGAWTPNWRHDTVCVDADLAQQIKERFDLELRPVTWIGRSAADRPPAWQLMIPVAESPWFDPEQLASVLEAQHGVAGATCPECGVWRWMPMSLSGLLVPAIDELDGVDAIAGPEWFGDGLKAFRETAFSPALAELISSTSPRDYRLRPWM
ncbi:MAG: hypothetical protein AAGE98_12165 [Actinomycetota bacterium]